MEWMDLYWDFGSVGPLLAVCSSSEGYDSSSSNGTTRKSRKVRFKIGTIGLYLKTEFS